MHHLSCHLEQDFDEALRHVDHYVVARGHFIGFPSLRRFHPREESASVANRQFCERVKGTKRTRATLRVVVLSGAVFSTTVSCWEV